MLIESIPKVIDNRYRAYITSPMDRVPRATIAKYPKQYAQVLFIKFGMARKIALLTKRTSAQSRQQ
jgi:hypothetical protein